jgi:hypothetical protein
VSASTFQREFDLDDVLEYVKTGIGSIIEDEVTQRFDSEELKVSLCIEYTRKRWNLSTIKGISELESSYSHKSELRICQLETYNCLDNWISCQIFYSTTFESLHTFCGGIC